jgi:dual specificity phosphatase 12
MSIDIDDMDDVDILMYFPRMVRFMDRALHGDASTLNEMETPADLKLIDIKPAADKRIKPGAKRKGAKPTDSDAITSAPPQPSASDSKAKKQEPGAVLVHCAMGKSRSVSAVLAYLLWKYPHRYGASGLTSPAKRSETAKEAVINALNWVRQGRPIAEPNPGFMRQLELWWAMGCPVDADNAVEKMPKYQRWLYEKELAESRALGRKPDWIVFEDEKEEKEGEEEVETQETSRKEIRCKKCRRVLANEDYIVPHRSLQQAAKRSEPCPHIFIEALSWMRPTLETEALDGRLTCPNEKCGATVGRFAWQGFKCSCGEWVCPAMSLNRARVDEVTLPAVSRDGNSLTNAATSKVRLPIRQPPGSKDPASANGGRGGQGEKELAGSPEDAPKQNL